MSFHTRVTLPVLAVLSLAFLIGCGSSHHVTPPPTGGFSNTNLSGTYVFSIVGFDGAANFESVTGTFTACGCTGGTISGGAIDFNDFTNGELANQPVTGGTYSVGSDGRGQATLTATPPWGGTTLIVDFVLASSSSGSITQFDTNGSASGTLDLQSAVSQPAAGNYVLVLSGINGSGGAPGAIAGAVAIDGSGNITQSVDYNQNTNPLSCDLTGSTITVSSTPGTAQLVMGSPCGITLNFDVYAVSANDYKLIETDQFPNFSGDLFLQSSSSFPSGPMAFSMAGIETSAAVGTTVLQSQLTSVMGGVMTSSGASAGGSAGTITAGEEDFNDLGNIDSTPQLFTGTITPPASGSRYVIQLDNFVNGNTLAIGSYQFAAYPYGSNSVALVEITPGVTDSLAAGVAFGQSSTSFASAQGYGMNVTAQNGGGFFENDIAEFTSTSTGFSGGNIDINDLGSQPSGGNSFSGTITMDSSPATGRGVFTSSIINGAIYTVSSNQVLFIETDTSQVGIGSLAVQNASSASSLSASNLAARHMMAVRAGAKALKARKAAEKK